jgi:hypothetical protein
MRPDLAGRPILQTAYNNGKHLLRRSRKLDIAASLTEPTRFSGKMADPAKSPAHNSVQVAPGKRFLCRP